MEYIFESDLAVSRLNTTFIVYQSTLADFIESLKKGSSTSGPVGHDFFQSMRICNVVSPQYLARQPYTGEVQAWKC